MDFSIVKKYNFFLHSPTLQSQYCTKPTIFFTFNDSMYSTNMVSSAFSPGIRKKKKN